MINMINVNLNVRAHCMCIAFTLHALYIYLVLCNNDDVRNLTSVLGSWL